MNYAVTTTVHVARMDNKRLTPEESKMVEEMQAAAEQAVIEYMDKHDRQKLADLGKYKVDY